MVPFADTTIDGGDVVWVLLIVLIILAIVVIARGRL